MDAKDPIWLSVGEARKIIAYNKTTGCFTWRTHAGNSSSGKQAGCVWRNGYRVITIKGKRILAHRLAWFLVRGRWPESQIDHRDRNRDNNSWKNLRSASSSDQKGNTILDPRNKSGYRGVSWHKNRKKWIASIKSDGRLRHLGYFDKAEDAAKSYAKAARAKWGKFYD